MLLINLMTQGIRSNLRARRWRERNPEKARLNCLASYKANLEKRRADARARREATPESAHEAVHKWQKANPEKVRAAYHTWRKENLEKARVLSRAWQKDNPDKVNAHTRLRYARLIDNGGSYTVEQSKTLGDNCLCCGRSKEELALVGLKLVLDHVLPVVLGGSTDISNLQPLCDGADGCNNHKGTKHIDYRKQREN